MIWLHREADTKIRLDIQESFSGGKKKEEEEEKDAGNQRKERELSHFDGGLSTVKKRGRTEDRGEEFQKAEQF